MIDPHQNNRGPHERWSLLLALLITCSVAFTTLSLRAQKAAHTAHAAQPDYLAAGPFYFAPGAVHPTDMDWFANRPVVKSPDGSLAVTVTGPKESYGAWVTVDPSAFPDGPVQVWPIQRDVDVLWRPDSRAFALTDNRYANSSYVLVFGTRFRMGENGPGLGVPITDLTPVVLKEFDGRAEKFYASNKYNADLIYIKVLRWVGSDQLLVGLDARTSLANPPGPTVQEMRIRDWYIGYVVDVPDKKVLREVSKSQLLSEYDIKVTDE